MFYIHTASMYLIKHFISIFSLSLIWSVLVILSADHDLLDIERRKQEFFSVQKDLFGDLQAFNLLEISQFLDSWHAFRSRDDVDLSTWKTRASLLDELYETSQINSNNCRKDILQFRSGLSRKYENYFNLGPYIRAVTWMQSNVCFQIYDDQLQKDIIEKVPRIDWFSWYNAINEKPLIIFKDAIVDNEPDQMLFLPIISQWSVQHDKIIKNIVMRSAFYLKLYVTKIESCYYNSELDHKQRITEEVEKIFNSICPHLNGGLENFSQEYNDYITDLRFKNILSDYGKVYHLRYVCKKPEMDQISNLTFIYFKKRLDYATIDVKPSTEPEPEPNIQDLVSSLYARISAIDPLIKTRLMNPLKIMDKITKDVILTIKPSERYVFQDLINLSKVNNEKCDNISLSLRIRLQNGYDQRYIALANYIESMNQIQFSLCNQQVGYQASKFNESLQDNVQVMRLELLRSMIKLSDHELLLDPPESSYAHLEDGIVEYFKKSKEIKTKGLSVDDLRLEMDKICKNVLELLHSPLELYVLLVTRNLAYRLDTTTKRILSYGKICELYHRYQYNIMPEVIENLMKSKRFRRYGIWSSFHNRISCFKQPSIQK